MQHRAWPLPDWDSSFSYKVSPRAFGSNRSGGRLHAGCDLYTSVGAAVLSIAPGKVVVSGGFYDGTSEVQVFHPGIGLVRYAELSVEQGINTGKTVNSGTVLGYVQKMRSISRTMLHIELFEHTDPNLINKKLTPPIPERTIELSGPYLRRKDLKDITPLLDSLKVWFYGK